jgi:breast cancer 2 susceptibility protein
MFCYKANPLNRQTLESSGLLPQQHTSNELVSMGMFVLPVLSKFKRSALTLPYRNITELSQITPITALYYSFHITTASPPSRTILPTLRCASTALDQLLDRGCWLATKPWVDNHWCLILWKLAGMACLDPESGAKRWCWDEVMRQLLYR